ncbi:MAG: Tyrosine-protein phosphatase precursor [Pseudomonadota bacterium]|jgi:protein-tyrosine phosphatase
MYTHPPQDLAQRHIPLNGASNFRDLGGYKGHAGRTVKWRKIFRSDHLAALDAHDLQQLHNLGVRRAFDFRGVQESQAQSYAWPNLKRHSLSIEPTVVQRLQAQHLTGKPLTAADALDAMQTTYRDFVRVDSHRFAELFEHLLDTPDPLLFHCTAGKDRTGLAATLVLSALGVSESDIWKDYLLTNQLYKRNSSGATSLSPDVLKIVWEVQESFLKASLDEIHAQHGSIQTYLTDKLKLTQAAQSKLHMLYLEATAG